MSGEIPILTYLWLTCLLTQLIYTRTKSPQKCLFLFHKTYNMTNDCVSVTKTLLMGVKSMKERYKKITHTKSKGQCKDEIGISKRINIFFLHNNDWETPYIDIYVDLLPINFDLLRVF